MRLTAPPESVPVRSMTRPVSGGTGHVAVREKRGEAQAARQASSRRRARAVRAAHCDGSSRRTARWRGACGRGRGGPGAKSTVGGLEIAASFSTVKFGFGL